MIIKQHQLWPTHSTILYCYIVKNDLKASVRLCKYDDHNSIESLYVNDNDKNKGIATKLITELINDNNEDLYLLVETDNTAAINLYHKKGFKFFSNENEKQMWMYLKQH